MVLTFNKNRIRECIGKSDGDGCAGLVPWTRRIGRPKRRWMDSIKDDLIEKGLFGEEVWAEQFHKKRGEKC